MSKEVAKVEALSPSVIEQVLLRGDLSKLKDTERLSYYKNLCHSLNLNPLTKPFEYMTLNGKTILYATKACTEQLRMRDGVSIDEIKIEVTDELVRATAKGKNREGRTDTGVGVVSIVGLKGDARANAEMKAETKAKRRLTLSLCGLGMLDETEVETIPEAKTAVRAEDVYDGTAEPDVYTIPFGKFKDQRPEDIPTNEMKSYIKWIFEKAEQKGVKIQDERTLELIDYCHSMWETAEMDQQLKNTIR